MTALQFDFKLGLDLELSRSTDFSVLDQKKKVPTPDEDMPQLNSFVILIGSNFRLASAGLTATLPSRKFFVKNV